MKKWKIMAVISPSLSAMRNSSAERKLRMATHVLSIILSLQFFQDNNKKHMKFLDSSLLNYIKALKLGVIPNKLILHLPDF